MNNIDKFLDLAMSKKMPEHNRIAIGNMRYSSDGHRIHGHRIDLSRPSIVRNCIPRALTYAELWISKDVIAGIKLCVQYNTVTTGYRQKFKGMPMVKLANGQISSFFRSADDIKHGGLEWGCNLPGNKDDLDILLNAKYLRDALSPLGQKGGLIEMAIPHNNNEPIMVKYPNLEPDIWALIMPINPH